jgi:hypothetical protein
MTIIMAMVMTAMMLMIQLYCQALYKNMLQILCEKTEHLNKVLT